MNKSYRTAGLIIVGIALLLVSGIFFPSEDNAAPSTSQQSQEKALMAVSVINSSLEPYTKDIILRGQTQALRIVDLKSQIKSRIVELPVEKGTRVKMGDIICRMDIEDREANHAEAVAVVKQRELEFKASEKLSAKGHRSETQHSAAVAALDSARAREKRAQIDLSNAAIRAPFDGIINDRLIEVGDYMREGDVCAVIMEEDPFLVVADISENDINQINAGDVARAKMQNGQEITGKIRFISSIADTATRTFRVELEVANPDYKILDGITAELIIQANQIMAQKLSPATLVLDDRGLVGVRTVDNDNLVHFKEVEIMGSHENGVWVAGLNNDEKIIIKGHEFVKAGESVIPVTATN